MKTHCFCVWNSQVPKSSYTRNGYPFSRFCLGFTPNPSAGNRCHFQKIDGFWKVCDVPRVGNHLFRISAINTIATILLTFTKCFPSSNAIFAMPTSTEQPRRSNNITLFHILHSPAKCNHIPMASWPGIKGSFGFIGQSPIQACKAVWQTPLVTTLINIWFLPGIFTLNRTIKKQGWNLNGRWLSANTILFSAGLEILTV